MGLNKSVVKIVILIPLLMVLLGKSAFPQTYPFWDKLQSGPYEVGFQTSWQLDYSRSYNTIFKDSTSYSPSKAPRPIFVCFWYPGQKNTQAKAMVQASYLDIQSKEPLLDKFSKHFIDYTRDIMATQIMGKPEEGFSMAEKKVWQQYLLSPSFAYKDIPPADGKFPLIIYRSGSGASYEDNAVLCEYLASHGYVVVGSAFQYTDGYSLDTDSGETSLADISFLISKAQKLPFVNWKKIALGGHSAGAQAIMRFGAKPNSVINALFLLDTTQDYHSLSNPLWDFIHPVLKNIEQFIYPSLVVAGPSAIFQLLDRLKESNRYYLTIDKMKHNEFISQGIMKKKLAHYLSESSKVNSKLDSEIGEKKLQLESLSKDYITLIEYILIFLNAHLKDDHQSLETLKTLHRNTPIGTAPSVEIMPKGQNFPQPYFSENNNPPSPRQLRLFFEKNGLKSSLELLDKFWTKENPHPIYNQTFGFVWVYELLEQGKEKSAQEIYKHYFRYHEKSLEGRFLRYGRNMEILGIKEEAQKTYQYLKKVDPENEVALEKLKTFKKKSP